MEIYEFDFDYRKWYKVQPIGENIQPRQYHTAVVRGECVSTDRLNSNTKNNYFNCKCKKPSKSTFYFIFN